MNRITCTAAVVFAFAAVPAASQARTLAGWAGYADVAQPGVAFTGVEATFRVPRMDCKHTMRGKVGDGAVFWAGLDGMTNQRVEQAGVWESCHGSASVKPGYHVFIEMYPRTATFYDYSRLRPGDLVTASVGYTTDFSYPGFGLYVHNLTRGWYEGSPDPEPCSTTGALSAAACPRRNAEVIAEDPLDTGGRPYLTNFGHVTFSAANVSADVLSGAWAGLLPWSNIWSETKIAMVPNPLIGPGCHSVSLDSCTSVTRNPTARALTTTGPLMSANGHTDSPGLDSTFTITFRQGA